MRSATGTMAVILPLRARLSTCRRGRPGGLLAIPDGGRCCGRSFRARERGTTLGRKSRCRRRPRRARSGRQPENRRAVQPGTQPASRLQPRIESENFRRDRLRASGFQGRPVPVADRSAPRGRLDFVFPLCRRPVGAANPFLPAGVGPVAPPGGHVGRLAILRLGRRSAFSRPAPAESRPRRTIRR